MRILPAAAGDDRVITTASLRSRVVDTRMPFDPATQIWTVVIGGIYIQEVGNNTTKVPLLGDIPVLGYLFLTGNTERLTEFLRLAAEEEQC